MRRAWMAAGSAGMVLAVVVLTGCGGGKIGKLKVNVESQGKGDSGTMAKSLVVSGDGKHAVFATSVRDKYAVVCAGKEGQPYKNITSLTTTFDGSRAAYAARTDTGKTVAVIGTMTSPEFDSFGQNTPRFSPDGKRAVAALFNGQECTVMCDGLQTITAGGFSPQSLAFSPDSRRIAFGVMNSKIWTMLVDGKQLGKEYDGFGYAVFSPDSRRLAFIGMRRPQFVAARGKDKFLVVVDGEESKEYDGVGAPCFSQDGKLAYMAQRDGKWVCVVNGQEGKEYDKIKPGNLFSRDGRRLAYVAGAGGGWALVVDGKESQTYPAIDSNGSFFSGDGSTVVFVAGGDGARKVVVNDKAGKEYKEINEKRLAFSDDGKMVAYAARTSQGCVLVRNEAEGPKYDEILAVAVSPDGKHVACVGKRGVSTHLFVDEAESEGFDGMPLNAGVVIDGKTASCLMFKPGEVVRVEATLK